MSRVSLKSIRRTAVLFCAVPTILMSTILATNQFIGPDSSAVLTLVDAWNLGVIQGFFILNILLVVAAIGIWHLRTWARWVAYVWFPLLAANNLLTEHWQLGKIQPENWLTAGVISLIWLWALYPFLASDKANKIFISGTDA